jgi:ribokinase
MINILVVGSSNTDMVIRVSRIPKPGETILGGEFTMAPGGKGANQAVAAVLSVTRSGAQPSAPIRAEIRAFLRANTESIAHKA